MINVLPTHHRPLKAQPQYIDLRLPDGTHSGARFDAARGVLEIRRKGVTYYFDLTLMDSNEVVDKSVSYCYNGS